MASFAWPSVFWCGCWVIKIDAPVGWVAAGGPLKLTLQPASGITDDPFLDLVERVFLGQLVDIPKSVNRVHTITCNFKHQRFA